MKKPNLLRSSYRSTLACVARRTNPHLKVRRFGPLVFSSARPLLPLLVLAFCLSASTAFSANVLLKDNYTGTGTTNPFDLNFNLTGRQTGLLAPVTYTPFGNAQVGNGGEPHDGGNVLLTAGSSKAALDHNFNGINATGG